MSTEFRIQWTQSARDDLLEIAKYIARDSIDIALKKVELIETKVKNLSTFPFEGKNVPELEEYIEEDYKQIIIHPWRVIYSISGNTVTILIVVDGRRDLQDILLKKLMK
jgi:toxin ParE1/3/4